MSNVQSKSRALVWNAASADAKAARSATMVYSGRPSKQTAIDDPYRRWLN